jgi:hypothetical protein
MVLGIALQYVLLLYWKFGTKKHIYLRSLIMHLLTISVSDPSVISTPMNSPQIRCCGCDRVFSPRGLSQHLSKDSACRTLQMASRMLSVFQNAPPAGPSQRPLGSIVSGDHHVVDAGNESSGELLTQLLESVPCLHAICRSFPPESWQSWCWCISCRRQAD